VRDIGIKYICYWKLAPWGLVQADRIDITTGGAGTGQARGGMMRHVQGGDGITITHAAHL
jgi:hypothetical protein